MRDIYNRKQSEFESDNSGVPSLCYGKYIYNAFPYLIKMRQWKSADVRNYSWFWESEKEYKSWKKQQKKERKKRHKETKEYVKK